LDAIAGTAECMTDTADHTDARETLWVTDAELIRRSGVPEKIARATIQELDRNRLSGFPQKQKIWGNRRYWPAVKAYFERMNSSKMGTSDNRRDRHDRPEAARY